MLCIIRRHTIQVPTLVLVSSDIIKGEGGGYFQGLHDS